MFRSVRLIAIVVLIVVVPSQAEVYQLFFSVSASGTNALVKTFLGDIRDFSSAGAPRDIEIDQAGGKVYWTGLGDGPGTTGIRRANLDGSCEQVVFSTTEGSTIALSLDVLGGKIYWTYELNVARANLDGSDFELLVTIPSCCPRQLALSPSDGLMFWSESNSIKRAGMDIPAGESATSRTDITTVANESCSAMLVDSVHGRLMWDNLASPSRLKSANLDGSDDQVVLTLNDGERFNDMELDESENMLYWTLNGGGIDKIQRVSLDQDSISINSVETIRDGSTHTNGGTIRYEGLAFRVSRDNVIPGDMNGDGLVDGRDLQVFVDRLLACP